MGATPFYEPGQVGTDIDWSSVAAAERYACALKSDGRAFCWGDNTYGQLGTGNTTSYAVPTQIAEPDGATMSTVWTKLSATSMTMCGLASGSVYCWGSNAYRQASFRSTSSFSVPTSAVQGTGWTDVAAGTYHTCAINAGAMWCWGYDYQGQAGVCPMASTNPRSPTQVGTATDWLSISGGELHTCGTRQTGEVWCWGDNRDGRLGNGTTWNDCVPQKTN